MKRRKKIYIDMFDLSILALMSQNKYSTELGEIFGIDNTSITRRIRRLVDLWPGIFELKRYNHGFPVCRWELTEHGKFIADELKITLEIIGYEHQTPTTTIRFEPSSNNRG